MDILRLTLTVDIFSSWFENGNEYIFILFTVLIFILQLGAGGLIRAYGGTARMALRAATKKILIPKSSIRVSTQSSNAGQIYATATKYSGIVGAETYDEKGDFEVTITCDTADFEAMCDNLTDATRGNIIFIED